VREALSLSLHKINAAASEGMPVLSRFGDGHEPPTHSLEIAMKSRFFAVTLLAILGAAPAFAAQPAATTAKPMSAQQQRMSTCAAANKGKKGAEYKAAQSACLKADSAAASKARTPQQERMAKCAAQNKGKKGNDYKAAQSDCLKGA